MNFNFKKIIRIGSVTLGLIVLLIFFFTNVDTRQDELQWSLEKYASEGNLIEVKKLIKIGAIAEKRSFQPPLHRAIKFGHIEIVDYLLEIGINPNEQSRGMSPLYIAVSENHYQIAEKLLLHKASANTSFFNYSSPISEACFNKNYAMVELLLKHNADPNFRNDRNETPLSIAKALNEPKLVLLLKQYGAFDDPPPSSRKKQKREISSTKLHNSRN